MDLGEDDPGQSGVPPESAETAVATPEMLAEQLRTHGVVVIAGRALTAGRPGGVDLLGALPVLTRQIAREWSEAAEDLPPLHPDRLQLRSAAALLTQAASVAEAGSDGPIRRELDVETVARAVTLRGELQIHQGNERPGAREPDSGAALLDRTWAVLCDLRRMVAGTSASEPGGEGGAARREDGVVPSAAQVDHERARALSPALHRAACAGSLVGLLAPWLPPARPDCLTSVDGLLESVSSMARSAKDDRWWSAMITVGQVAASLSVAAAHAEGRHDGPDGKAACLILSEPPMHLLVDRARSAAATLVGEASPRLDETRPPAVVGPPQASPSQQARAAAERAAAERRATQQAFMERAQATRNARGAVEPESDPPVESAPPDRAAPDRGDPENAAASEQAGTVDVGVWDTLMRRR